METTSSSPNETLQQALENQTPRFFRASRGSAKGKTGTEDTAQFAENLLMLQECAVLLGEKLNMNAVAGAVCYEGEETFGFCFDQNSNPQQPEVAGAMVNKRIPMAEFSEAIRDYINS